MVIDPVTLLDVMMVNKLGPKIIYYQIGFKYKSLQACWFKWKWVFIKNLSKKFIITLDRFKHTVRSNVMGQYKMHFIQIVFLYDET